MKTIPVIFFFICGFPLFVGNLFSQTTNAKIDSLELVLKREKNDSARANLFINLASLTKDSAKKFNYTERAEQICLKNNFKKPIERVYEIRARYYYAHSKFVPAVDNWLLCLNLSQQISDSSMEANADFHLGNIFKDFNNFPVAFSYYKKSEKIYEASGDTSFLELTFESLGALYNDLTKKQDSAKYYFDDAIRLSIILKKNPSLEYLNLAEWYKDNKQFENSLRTYLLADSCYALRNPVNAEYGHVWVTMGQGDLFLHQGNYKAAVDNFKIAYAYGKKNADAEMLSNLLFPLYDAENKLGDKSEALKYLQEYVVFTDSTKGENNTRQILLAQSQFEIQQKDKLDQLEKEKEDAQHNAELSRQRLIIWSTIAVLSIVLIVLIFIFRSYRVNKKAKEAIAKQKELVEEKQKEILDSIHYAKRIQQSMMPTEKYIAKQLSKNSAKNN